MSNEKIIWDAEFNDSVTTYWLLSGILVCIFSIIGIAFLPIWFFAGKWITRRYLASHVCTLTSRSLQVRKGIWTKVEKTVPLDRITDVGIVQGPIMRYYGIEALSVETAGQSTPSSLIRLAGIKEGREFRDAILKQRDLVVGSEEERAQPHGGSKNIQGGEVVEILGEIRDSLAKIETAIEKYSQ